MKPDYNFIKELSDSHEYDYLSETVDEKEIVTRDTPNIDTPLSRTISTIVLTIALIALIIIAIRKFGYFFKIDKKKLKKTGMGDDTIYGHDWVKEITDAMQKHDYGTVAVLCYLRRLKQLNDEGIIEFRHSKTPGMFLDEAQEYISKHKTTIAENAPEASVPETKLVVSQKLYDDTDELTKHYLRVRYGHKETDRETAQRLIAL